MKSNVTLPKKQVCAATPQPQYNQKVQTCVTALGGDIVLDRLIAEHMHIVDTRPDIVSTSSADSAIKKNRPVWLCCVCICHKICLTVSERARFDIQGQTKESAAANNSVCFCEW